MQKLLAFFLAMMLSVSVIAGCGSNSPKTNDKQTTQTTNVNTTKSNNGQNTAANVKANSDKIKISESAAYTDKEHVAAYINEYKRLPHNYITKNEAKKLGWQTKAPSTRLHRENPSAVTVTAITRASCRRKTAVTGRNAILIM